MELKIKRNKLLNKKIFKKKTYIIVNCQHIWDIPYKKRVARIFFSTSLLCTLIRDTLLVLRNGVFSSLRLPYPHHSLLLADGLGDRARCGLYVVVPCWFGRSVLSIVIYLFVADGLGGFAGLIVVVVDLTESIEAGWSKDRARYGL